MDRRDEPGTSKLDPGGGFLQIPRPNPTRRTPCTTTNTQTTSPFYERSSKRRKGFPSETRVKRGRRILGGGKELSEKLGRNDPCPCGSGRRFQILLPRRRPLRRHAPRRLFSATEVDGRRIWKKYLPAVRGCGLFPARTADRDQRPVRLSVRTPDFHSGKKGSTPLRVAIRVQRIKPPPRRGLFCGRAARPGFRPGDSPCLVLPSDLVSHAE